VGVGRAPLANLNDTVLAAIKSAWAGLSADDRAGLAQDWPDRCPECSTLVPVESLMPREGCRCVLCPVCSTIKDCPSCAHAEHIRSIDASEEAQEASRLESQATIKAAAIAQQEAEQRASEEAEGEKQKARAYEKRVAEERKAREAPKAE